MKLKSIFLNTHLRYNGSFKPRIVMNAPLLELPRTFRRRQWGFWSRCWCWRWGSGSAVLSPATGYSEQELYLRKVSSCHQKRFNAFRMYSVVQYINTVPWTHSLYKIYFYTIYVIKEEYSFCMNLVYIKFSL